MLHTYRAFSSPDADRGITFLVSFDADDDADARFLPYAALRRAVAAAARTLAAAGVDADARVIFSFDTNPETIVTFLGLLALGALPLSIRPGAGDSHREFVAAIARRYRVTHVVGVEEAIAASLELRHLALAPVEVDGPDAPLPEFSPERLAFVQFSSGSTSFPKGVPITHGKLVHNLRIIVESDQRTRDECGTSWLPLYHDMGLVGSLLSSLYAGNNLHLARPVDFLMRPLDWLRHLSRTRSSFAVLPNFALDYVIRHLGDDAALAGVELSALRGIYLGSEPINIENLEVFRRRLAGFGLRPGVVKPCYGMAEAVLMVSSTGIDDDFRVVPRPGGVRAISVGRVHPDFEVRIIGEEGERCSEGEAGEIELRGGTLAGAYFEDERRFADDDGWYATGDIGFVDGGALFISGRASDRFKINAQSYFSSDIEQLVEGLEFVRPQHAAAVYRGGRVVILAEVRRTALADPTPHRQAIVDRIDAALGVKVELEDVRFIRSRQLLRTSSGKLRRQALADALERGQIKSAI
ncbi:MAG: AMP-binding protein [Myxococcales bacterium]|nr:AMP-binding protein [Myxococcales bacterium]